MTTTMAHEMATQRTGRVGRPFTAAEDDTLRRLAAEGHTRRQIADAMGRQYHSVRHRGDRGRAEPGGDFTGDQPTEDAADDEGQKG